MYIAGLRQSPTTDKPGVPVGTVDQLKKLHTGADKCNTSLNGVTPAVSKNWSPDVWFDEISTKPYDGVLS